MTSILQPVAPEKEPSMRRFEYLDDKSAKFREVEQQDLDLTIRRGRIGTTGQSQTKTFADGASAGAAMLKLIKEKTTKGYTEQASTPREVIGTAPAKAAPPEAAPAEAPGRCRPHARTCARSRYHCRGGR
jgi:predicted DNA-binding WGR domain protein